MEEGDICREVKPRKKMGMLWLKRTNQGEGKREK